MKMWATSIASVSSTKLLITISIFYFPKGCKVSKYFGFSELDDSEWFIFYSWFIALLKKMVPN